MVDPQRGEQPDAGALMDWVAARVAPYKRLRDVRFVAALPRIPTGKLLRRVLVDRDCQRAATPAA